MKFFADTASIPEIEYCFSRGANQGITTNPRILELTGDLSLGFEGACKAIVSIYPNVPISLETDLRGFDVLKFDEIDPHLVRDSLLQQAYGLSEFGDNVVVKIPFCAGGILATKQLSKLGIKTNVTATMDSNQALCAAAAGATYTNIFVNRRLDFEILRLAGHNIFLMMTYPSWKDVVAEEKSRYGEAAWDITLKDMAYASRELESTGTSLIGASLRDPSDILRIATTKPQVITIPTNILRGLEANLEELKQYKRTYQSNEPIADVPIYSHPMTLRTLLDFEKAADSYRK